MVHIIVLKPLLKKQKKYFKKWKNKKKIKSKIYNYYTRRYTLKNNNKLKISTEPIRKSNTLHEIKRNKTLNKNNK